MWDLKDEDKQTRTHTHISIKLHLRRADVLLMTFPPRSAPNQKQETKLSMTVQKGCVL